MTGIDDIARQFDPRLAAVLGWIVLMAKIMVDWLKTATTLPKWGPPAVCFGATTVLIVLVMLALGIPVTVQLAAQGVLLAVIGTAVAIGSTVLQSRTQPSADTQTAVAVADEIVRRIRTAESLATRGDAITITRGHGVVRTGHMARSTETAP